MPVQNTEQIYPAPFVKKPTTFPQIHSNLNGKVREFVRTMFQDKKGNYWFGTNGDGIIRYDGKHLETMTIEGMHPNFRVLEIVEDQIEIYGLLRQRDFYITMVKSFFHMLITKDYKVLMRRSGV